MLSQALSGVIALRLVSREGSPSLLEVRHTHTHTHTFRAWDTHPTTTWGGSPTHFCRCRYSQYCNSSEQTISRHLRR
jgi:hypothetical protein